MISVVKELSKRAKEVGNRIAVIGDDEQKITYAELWKEVQGFAMFLKSKGVVKGNNVVVKSKHSVDFVVSCMAIHLIGAVHVPTEETIGNEGLDSIVELMEAQFVIADEYTSRVDFVPLANVRRIARDNVPEKEIEQFPQSEDIADILFTTGTTGRSKGVMISHRAIVAVAENVIHGVDMPKDNIYLVPTPINHASGIRKIYVSIITGTTVILLNGFSNMKKFFQIANKYNVTSILMPPSAIRILLMFGRDELAALSPQLDHIHTGTAPLSDADKKRLRETLPDTKLFFGYGSSESGCVCLYDYNKYKDLQGCTGKANINAKIFIVDDERNEIKSSIDNPGTVAIFGPMNMTGYYNEPELTSSVLENGFVYTTDIGYKDENGFLYLLGRKDDVINLGGLKIAPTEIENIALKYSGISECICYATGDDSNMSVCLDIVTEPGATVDTKQVKSFISDSLEAYKVPKTISIVKEIPKTFNGKLDRKAMKKIVLERRKG